MNFWLKYYFKNFDWQFKYFLIMKICFASKLDSENVVKFFDKNLKKEDFWKEIWDYFYEYFCPFWVRAAVKRKEIILLKDFENIIGALRFYPRKNSEIASLYQFAFEENIKNRKVLNIMLKFTWYKIFHSLCIKDSNLNKYFENQNWELIKNDKKFNYWKLCL